MYHWLLAASLGRRNTIVLGGLTFLASDAVNGGAVNVTMLILGRILLGLVVGFTNQATPIYLSEVAPPKWRGAFNTCLQFFTGIGVVAVNCINFGTAKQSWGWRISLGLTIVPAAMMTIGALLISDTRNSLIERGKEEQARESIPKVCGKDCDLEAELTELKKASDVAKEAKREPFVTIFERHYRPHLVMSIAIPFLEQLRGINIIAFYAPVLFKSVGLGNDSALLAPIIFGLVYLASVLVSTCVVDWYSRRFSFINGGI
ncbi:Sugar transport protein 5 [Hibiscus syriacus]|uniref:Sugar transport protein 5 n=1 Tax=Hibiscus syriacus TaxID=106335 RepID=A0A6A2WF13_HIBSY|nr:Sugar transport protein 5 [Hibiscus syriacus]